ncbi:hypothetical protein Bbelb_425290 [Branchiostoma belcheri]|nr:hypothetical protein Bbelb_425290 [Branchiostoma belcheri]
MAAPVPVLRGDVTLVDGSLMEVWKKEDEDAAAEREEYREEWAMFEEDMTYLAHLDLESSVVTKDELQVSAELIVSQDRCFASTHVLYVEESLDRTNTGVVRVKA